MRLDFNYILIDDDLKHHQNKRRVLELSDEINKKIEAKGLVPNPQLYPDIASFEKNINDLDKNRFDLYLSDNNLGNANTSKTDNFHTNDGIEIYLKLHKLFPCNFVLYSGATQDQLIQKLVEHLQTKKDAGLFSRFTFISRSSDRNDKWYDPILDLIDLIVSSREEMNTMRGFYAQLTSQIHYNICAYCNLKLENTTFYKAIKTLETELQKAQQADTKQSLTLHDIAELNEIRLIRNGLAHRDEGKCDLTPHAYYLSYTDSKNAEKRIYITDFPTYRTQLKNMHEKIKNACNIP